VNCWIMTLYAGYKVCRIILPHTMPFPCLSRHHPNTRRKIKKTLTSHYLMECIPPLSVFHLRIQANLNYGGGMVPYSKEQYNLLTHPSQKSFMNTLTALKIPHPSSFPLFPSLFSYILSGCLCIGWMLQRWQASWYSDHSIDYQSIRAPNQIRRDSVVLPTFGCLLRCS